MIGTGLHCEPRTTVTSESDLRPNLLPTIFLAPSVERSLIRFRAARSLEVSHPFRNRCLSTHQESRIPLHPFEVRTIRK